MPDDMSTRLNRVRRNSWLCNYAICQIGKPYWFATSGQISSPELYRDVCLPAMQSQLGDYYYYDNYMDQLNVKVHDCAGLVAGALTCESVGGEPTLSNPLTNQSSMFYSDCSSNSNDMYNFPYTPGTLVFHTNSLGSKTHVGIYVGKFTDLNGKTYSNTVVEAMGHDYGVTTSDINDSSRWDSWGQLDCSVIDTTKDTAFDARSVSVANSGPITINTQAMKPFVATLSPRFNYNLDYDKIKEARISAMAFFGGELFDVNHQKRAYINPYLDHLVKQCNDAGMPYMMYVYVRSTNVIEADEECRALYYVVSQFPPRLGLWLCLKTNVINRVNNDILEVYYKYIEKWGLKGKCGLYLGKDQLSEFDWNSFQDRFNLWLIDPMDVTKVDDELLQPEMFEVPD